MYRQTQCLSVLLRVSARVTRAGGTGATRRSRPTHVRQEYLYPTSVAQVGAKVALVVAVELLALPAAHDASLAVYAQ